MFGIKYIKFDASTYVIHYSGGKIKKEGRGLSFWYFEPTASIMAIPAGSDDAQFIFEEVTADYQNVTIQGQLTFQIKNPKQLAELLDFTVNKHGKYQKDDIEKLSQRLVNEVQASVKSTIQSLSLREATNSASQMEKVIIEHLKTSEVIQSLGVQPLTINVLGIKPMPEMSRALEAKTREALQQDADEAIYARRKFAVVQERTIKETELNTQIAVEEKKKQIAQKKMETDIAKAENDRKLREMKIAADIEVEAQRKTLIDLQSENERKQADTEIYKLEKTLEQYKDMDWKKLMALQGNVDAKAQIAVAFRELAENSQNINNLNITPDLLNNLMNQPVQQQTRR